MATVLACWNRIGKRRFVRTAAAIGFILLSALALAVVPFGTMFRAKPRAAISTLEYDSPTPAPTGSGTSHAAVLSPIRPNEDRPKERKVLLAERPSAAPVDLGRLASGRVLTSVTQLALALPPAPAASGSLQGEDANSQLLRKHFARLKAGRDQFSRIPGYTATMAKQEQIGSSLSEEMSLAIKVRHQPFSVYMKWQSGDDTGKEVLYVDGVDDGQLLVRLGGLKGRILPAFKVDPFGSLALNKSRYPITKLGILALTDTLIERRELEMRSKIVPRVEQKPDAACDGRACSVYVFEVSDRERSPVYRKSVQYIDREWNVPLRVANYTWPEPAQHLAGPALDEATLIEYYMYSEIVTDARLSDRDFDRANAEYHFHR